MRQCQICKKKSIIQKSGVHQYGGAWAKRATKKSTAWLPNLHYVKVTYRGVRRTMRLCTKCLRKVKNEIKKVEAMKKVETPKVSASSAIAA